MVIYEHLERKLKGKPTNQPTVSPTSKHLSPLKSFTNHRVFSFFRQQEDSPTFKNAQKLEKFFEQQLAKWLPKYLEGDSFDEYLQLPAKRIKSLQED